jgi:hypothetical protein
MYIPGRGLPQNAYMVGGPAGRNFRYGRRGTRGNEMKFLVRNKFKLSTMTMCAVPNAYNVVVIVICFHYYCFARNATIIFTHFFTGSDMDKKKPRKVPRT